MSVDISCGILEWDKTFSIYFVRIINDGLVTNVKSISTVAYFRRSKQRSNHPLPVIQLANDSVKLPVYHPNSENRL